jgi:hypothetical protein
MNNGKKNKHSSPEVDMKTLTAMILLSLSLSSFSAEICLKIKEVRIDSGSIIITSDKGEEAHYLEDSAGKKFVKALSKQTNEESLCYSGPCFAGTEEACMAVDPIQKVYLK